MGVAVDLFEFVDDGRPRRQCPGVADVIVDEGIEFGCVITHRGLEFLVQDTFRLALHDEIDHQAACQRHYDKNNDA